MRVAEVTILRDIAVLQIEEALPRRPLLADAFLETPSTVINFWIFLPAHYDGVNGGVVGVTEA
jgi:hypothetical protein